MLRGNPILACLFAGTVSAVAARAAPAMFEKPLGTETGSGQTRYKWDVTWTCTRYPHFTVKAEYYGGSGADFFAVPDYGGPFGCADRMRGERRLSAYGRLTGVRGDYVLLDDLGIRADRQNQPLRFGFFDGTTGKSLLEDSMSGAWTSLQFTANGFVLRYRRVFQSDCSLRFGLATDCWTRIKRATGLTDAMGPDCRALYDAKRKATQYADQLPNVDRTPVMISYDVETRYEGGKTTFTPRPGKVDCALAY